MTLGFSGSSSGPCAARRPYVKTKGIKAAADGREAEIARLVGIPWRGRDHIRCPYPDHDDKDPSWRLMDSGLVICTCCDGKAHSIFDAVMKVLGLDFEAAKMRVAEVLGRTDLIIDPLNDKGLTLEEYGETKKLPLEFLGKLGVREQNNYRGKTAVRIPYFRLNGGSPAIKFRVAMTGKKKTYWRKNEKALLYDEWYAEMFRKARYVVIVEGESDCHTCWLHNFAAYGLPGSAAWNEERDTPLCEGIEHIFVIVEPDLGGAATLAWLSRSSIASRARIIRTSPELKDPSALYLANPAEFVDAFNKWLKAAEPIPPEVIETPPQRPRHPLDEIVDEFNSKYAVVNEAGQAIVYQRIADPVLQRTVVTRISFADLKKFYQNRPITGLNIRTGASFWAASSSIPPTGRPIIAGIFGQASLLPRRPATGA